MSHVQAEFAKLMVALAERYPNVRLREGTIRAYALDLRDLTLAEVERGMQLAALESDYFPTVSMIRRAVRPNIEEAGLRAWASFRRAAEELGAYRNIEVEDTYAYEALVATFGSWPQYCEIEEGPELALKRQEFLAHYRGARRYYTGNGGARLLLGLTDQGRGAITRDGAVLDGRVLPQLQAGETGIVQEEEKP